MLASVPCIRHGCKQTFQIIFQNLAHHVLLEWVLSSGLAGSWYGKLLRWCLKIILRIIESNTYHGMLCDWPDSSVVGLWNEIYENYSSTQLGAYNTSLERRKGPEPTTLSLCQYQGPRLRNREPSSEGHASIYLILSIFRNVSFIFRTTLKGKGVSVGGRDPSAYMPKPGMQSLGTILSGHPSIHLIF